MTTDQFRQIVNGSAVPVARIDASSGGMVAVLALDDGGTTQVVTAERLIEMIRAVVREELDRHA